MSASRQQNDLTDTDDTLAGSAVSKHSLQKPPLQMSQYPALSCVCYLASQLSLLTETASSGMQPMKDAILTSTVPRKAGQPRTVASRASTAAMRTVLSA